MMVHVWFEFGKDALADEKAFSEWVEKMSSDFDDTSVIESLKTDPPESYPAVAVWHFSIDGTQLFVEFVYPADFPERAA